MKLGDRVENVVSGARGTIRAIFTDNAGRTRIVVELDGVFSTVLIVNTDMLKVIAK